MLGSFAILPCSYDVCKPVNDIAETNKVATLIAILESFSFVCLVGLLAKGSQNRDISGTLQT